MYGHDYHFHIRIKCPPGSDECESQPEPTEGEGCSAGDLAFWFRDSVLHPKPPDGAAEAEAADDDGGAAARLQGGADCAGREAVAAVPKGERTFLGRRCRLRRRVALPGLPACYCLHCDIPADRKSSGLPERRFRLSHPVSTNA